NRLEIVRPIRPLDRLGRTKILRHQLCFLAPNFRARRIEGMWRRRSWLCTSLAASGRRQPALIPSGAHYPPSLLREAVSLPPSGGVEGLEQALREVRSAYERSHPGSPHLANQTYAKRRHGCHAGKRRHHEIGRAGHLPGHPDVAIAFHTLLPRLQHRLGLIGAAGELVGTPLYLLSGPAETEL